MPLFCLVTFLIFLGCKKEEGGGIMPEDFSFPPSADTAVTLFSGVSSVSVNQAFDVKLICYNVDSTFGASFEVGFPNTKIQVVDVLVGPFFSPPDQTIQLMHIQNDSARVSFGISYVRGGGRTSAGSGVVCKIRCVPIVTGTIQFTFHQLKVELRKEDGTFIRNYSRLQYQNLSMIVQ